MKSRNRTEIQKQWNTIAVSSAEVERAFSLMNNISQKQKCTGLATILSSKRQTIEISYIILRYFQNVFTFKNLFITAKVIDQTTKF
jgi:hypothetical protein